MALCARVAFGAMVAACTTAPHSMATSIRITIMMEQSESQDRICVYADKSGRSIMSSPKSNADLKNPSDRAATEDSNLIERLTVNLPRTTANCCEMSGN